MQTIFGSFQDPQQAQEATADLQERGVFSQVFATGLGDAPEPDPDCIVSVVSVDVSSGDIDQELVEGVLQDHNAAKVYAATDTHPTVKELSHMTPPSTGTYEVHSPVGGGEHGMDIVTDMLSQDQEQPLP